VGLFNRPRSIEPVDVNGTKKYRLEGDTQPQLYNTPGAAERRSKLLDRIAKNADRPLGSS
jgi:predicted ATPase